MHFFFFADICHITLAIYHIRLQHTHTHTPPSVFLTLCEFRCVCRAPWQSTLISILYIFYIYVYYFFYIQHDTAANASARAPAQGKDRPCCCMWSLPSRCNDAYVFSRRGVRRGWQHWLMKSAGQPSPSASRLAVFPICLAQRRSFLSDAKRFPPVISLPSVKSFSPSSGTRLLARTYWDLFGGLALGSHCCSASFPLFGVALCLPNCQGFCLSLYCDTSACYFLLQSWQCVYLSVIVLWRFCLLPSLAKLAECLSVCLSVTVLWHFCLLLSLAKLAVCLSVCHCIVTLLPATFSCKAGSVSVCLSLYCDASACYFLL